MKTTQLLPAALLASALLTTGALAQTSTMSSSAAPATAMASEQPTQFVYVPQLPTPADLVNGAKTQGVTVSKVEQVNGQVIAFYTYPNGQSSVVAFALLPAQGAAPAAGTVPVPATAAPAVVGTTTVIYDQAYPYYPAGYYPYYGYGWYPPISVGLGFGWGGGFRGGWGGGFHGGFRR